jgi:hypothetical protein
MSHAVRMIAEAQARRAQALADDDEAEVRKCDAQIARWERVKADVDAAPPLAGEARDKLAVLLRPAPAEVPIARRRRAAAREAA